jgi:invasion protein IalB
MNLAIREIANRPASQLIAGLVVLLAAAQPAMAQQERLKSTHDDWLVKCGQPAGASQEICWVEQKVTSEDRPNVGLTVIYRPAKKGEEGTLQIQAPLGVMLPRGLGLKIDDKDVGNVPFLRCLKSGCLAHAQVPDDLLNQFKAGGTAIFIVFDTPEAGIGIPIALKGFAEAIDGVN